MNVTAPPFNDLRVRKAIALTTDRDKMIEIAVEGWGRLGGFISPHLPFALPLEELKLYPQYQPDMEKRRAEAPPAEVAAACLGHHGLQLWQVRASVV